MKNENIKLLLFVVIIIAMPPYLAGEPFYRDGNGDGDPTYTVDVEGSDPDGDLLDVKLFVRDDFENFELALVSEKPAVDSLGDETISISSSYTFNAPPGITSTFRADARDSLQTVSTVRDITIGDRNPTVSLLSGASMSLSFTSSSADDYDLDYAELYVRTKLTTDASFSASWTQVNISTYVTRVLGANVDGAVVRAENTTNTPEFEIDLTYIATTGDDYQFRWVTYDAPEGDGALSAEVLTGPIRGQTAEVRINAIAFPVEGYEAWFEPSHLKSTVYQVN